MGLSRQPNNALLRQDPELLRRRDVVSTRQVQTDAAGDVLFVMRYGSRPLEIDKGKTAINVGKKENLIPVIDALITAVRNGELDEAVKALDRPRIKKKAA